MVVMLVGKFRVFIFLVVFAAFAVSLNQAYRVETPQKSDHHWRRKKLEQSQPPPFFAGNKRPEGLPNTTRGKEIQQTLPRDPNGTAPYFVSLFDPERNIPFYSAYKVTPQQAPLIGTYHRKDVEGHWRNPPGVPGLDDAYKALIRKQRLSRGHMDPLAINTFDKHFMEATYTLTNAAPQYDASNSGPWKMYEAKVRWYAQNICGSRSRGGTLYLLTGTSDYGLPSDLHEDTTRYTTTKLSGVAVFPREVKLVIPHALWTAGCCRWNETSLVTGRVGKTESFAVMSNNANDTKLLNQTEMSVAELERYLTAAGSPLVNLFPGDAGCRIPRNDKALPDYDLLAR